MSADTITQALCDVTDTILGLCCILSLNISDLISGMDVTVEISRLEKERALGNARHRKQVWSYFCQFSNV